MSKEKHNDLSDLIYYEDLVINANAQYAEALQEYTEKDSELKTAAQNVEYAKQAYMCVLLATSSNAEELYTNVISSEYKEMTLDRMVAVGTEILRLNKERVMEEA